LGSRQEVQFLVILTENVPPGSENALALLSNAYSLAINARLIKIPLEATMGTVDKQGVVTI